MIQLWLNIALHESFAPLKVNIQAISKGNVEELLNS